MITSVWPFACIAVAIALILVSRVFAQRVQRWLLPLATFAIFVALWHIGCELERYEVRNSVTGAVRVVEQFPTPLATLRELGQMLQDGALLHYSLASLYRVAIGFGLAVMIGVPLGLAAGWSTRLFYAINPLVQGLRPISPIAWIFLAIMWFGIADAPAIFLIFLASFFPIITGTVTAVHAIPIAYLRSAQNFRLRRLELVRYVIFPAALPQIITSLRLALGIAWMVIVAAEMIAVTSGLGYLITDARNGNNYARVCGSMVCIGLIGVGLDAAIRQLQKLDEVRWGFSKA